MVDQYLLLLKLRRSQEYNLLPGQRVLVLVDDPYRGRLGIVVSALPHEVQVKMDGGGILYFWESELLPISKKVTASKLRMLRHLYSDNRSPTNEK